MGCIRRLQGVGATIALGLSVIALGSESVPVEGASVEPEVVSGNPQCASLDLTGFKVEGPAPTGAYDDPASPGVSVEISASTGHEFDWSSTFGLDAVIVKGSDAANVYRYADARADDGLVAPVNSSGGTARISHVEFCFDGREDPATTADVGSVEGARGVAIDDVPLAALPASLVNLVAGADLVNDAGTGLRFSGTGLRFSGTGLRFSGTGLRFSGTGLRFSGTGLRFSGDGVGTFVGLRSAGTGLRFSGTGLRFSGTGLRFSDIPAWDVPLNELQPPEGFGWDDVFAAVGQYEGFPPQNVTFGQLLDAVDELDLGNDPAAVDPAIRALSEMSLLDLDPNGAVLRDVSLVGLLLGGTRLVDIPLPPGSDWCTIIDPEFDSAVDGPCTDGVVGDTSVLGLNLAGLRSDNLPLDEIALDGIVLDPDSVLADLLDDAGTPGDVHVPAEPGESLASYLVRGIDALNVPWELLPLREPDFDVRDFAFGEPVTITSSWAQVGAREIVASVSAPPGFERTDATCSVSVGECAITSTGSDLLVSGTGTAGIQTVELDLTYRPRGLLGTADAPSSGSFDVVVDGVPSSLPISVIDPWSGFDPGGDSPPPVHRDVLYFATTGGAGVDRYALDLDGAGPGSHVAVRIANLTSDADLVLYRNAGTGLRFSGTGMRFSGTGLRFSGTGLRFSGEETGESVENRESETLEDVPVDAGRLVEDVSANRSTTPEAADGFTDPATSGFEIQVSGFNSTPGESTDYVLRAAITEFGDPCTSSGAAGASVAFPAYAGEDTLVLFPQARFAADDPTNAIGAALADLDAFWPGGISIAGVTTSGADWTTEDGICSVFAANAVAEDISAAVQAWVADKDVDHVVLIGGDDRLPFYRSPDTTLIANEVSYWSAVGGDNPLTDALATSHFLTDDIYGDDDPWPFLNRLYFTPERAVGRLVESVDDIVGQIDRFISSQGRIDVERAVTAGYDFLSDAAVEIDAALAEVSSERTTLISDLVPGVDDDWSAADLRSALAGPEGDGSSLSLASIEGHMDQGLLLTAVGDAQGDTPDATEVVGPSDRDVDGQIIESIIPAGVDGAVMFTAGCHAGFSQVYANASRTDDWAESLAGGPAAIYLANTGYGYGIDLPIVAYSEELLVEFADGLELDGQTAGQAMVFAKQAYFADQLEIDPYDEKSQMQLTLYGLPMYSLTGPTAAAGPTAPALTSVIDGTLTDPATGLASASVDIANAFAARAGQGGTTYFGLTSSTANGVPAETDFEKSDGSPIQPKMAADVTSPDDGLIATGAVIEDLETSRVDLDQPTVARAVVDNTEVEAPVASGVVIFPTAFVNVNSERTATGPRSELVVVPAQYDSTEEAEQLLVDSLTVRTYYAPVASSDVVRPQFRNVSASASGGDVLFRADVFDPDDASANIDGTGIRRVVVQYFDGASWHRVEMFPAGGDEWSGGIPASRIVDANGEWFATAVDGVGLTATTANKGANFEVAGAPAQAVAFVEGDRGDNGWYVSETTVTLKGSAVVSGVSHTVTLGGTSFTYDSPFSVDDEGSTTVLINGPGATPIEVDVSIDTRAPIVELADPIAVLGVDDTIAPADLDECRDPDPGSGLLDLDPDATSSCALTTADYALDLDDGTTVGPFTLSAATGRDVAGNTSSESQSAVILSGDEGQNGYYTSPVILGVIGAAALEPDAVTIALNGVVTPYTEPIEIVDDTNVVVSVGDDEFEFDILVDLDAPTVAASPAPMGTYDLDELVEVTCDFGDAGSSGLTSVQCGPVVIAAPDPIPPTISTTVDTSTPGAFVFVAAATDAAGNTTVADYPYEVDDPCDPVGDAVDPNGDIVRCATEVFGDRTAAITITVAGTIADDGTQYRLELADAPDASGAQVKWAAGKESGKQLVSATVDGPSITFLIDLAEARIGPGETLFWSASVQDGEKGKPTSGFLDFAPDVGAPHFALPT